MDFDIHLMQAGFTAKKAQIIGASFVEVPKQRNNKAKNNKIKKKPGFSNKCNFLCSVVFSLPQKHFIRQFEIFLLL